MIEWVRSPSARLTISCICTCNAGFRNRNRRRLIERLEIELEGGALLVCIARAEHCVRRLHFPGGAPNSACQGEPDFSAYVDDVAASSVPRFSVEVPSAVRRFSALRRLDVGSEVRFDIRAGDRRLA